MNLELRNRRVLVTGSSQGIGHAIATAFLAERARVAVTGRDRVILHALMKEWAPKFGAAHVLACPGDLTSAAVVSRVLGRIKKTWGGLDVLVLNLGSGRSALGLPDATEWNRVLGLNLVAAMDTLRLAMDLLSQGRKPSVVLVGSIAGLEALGAPISYGAAKAGLRHAMKAAAQQLAGHGIRVNMVAPGNIFFLGGTWDKKMKEEPETTVAMLEAQVPLRRFGTAKEVAGAVVFLASGQASFITGACLTVDGGQTRT
ncbi:MAG TPA: SDR family NAD(P)-dependent oxidoreductase [Opitutaceae bacterium]|jgi:3-oxoacyl-[acyl-carrier protein] reductase|nr:SDR family NAD(P)-dependent oxidoreductase [Opitutaceae bacterium]